MVYCLSFADYSYHLISLNLFILLLLSVRDEIGRLDPYAMKQGTGVLGRIADMLSTDGNNVNAFTVDENFNAVEGALQSHSRIAIDSKKGFIRFNPADADQSNGEFFGQYSEILNGKVDGYNNIFSDTWSSAFVSQY